MPIFSSYPRSGSKAKNGENTPGTAGGQVITMAKLRMAHASTHGARKPPGPKKEEKKEKKTEQW